MLPLPASSDYSQKTNVLKGMQVWESAVFYHPANYQANSN